MAHVLKHPKTGRTVSVTEKHAEFYTGNGWVAVKPKPTEAELAAKAAEKEAVEKEAVEKEAADLATKQAAEAAEKEADSKKESADGSGNDVGKPAPRKAAKAS